VEFVEIFMVGLTVVPLQVCPKTEEQQKVIPSASITHKPNQIPFLKILIVVSIFNGTLLMDKYMQEIRNCK
jgi:hypothetical protein